MEQIMISQNSRESSPSVGSDVSFEYNTENPTNPVRKNHFLRQDKDLVRLIIFNIGDASVPVAWEWLRGCLDADTLRAIISIEKVDHASGKPRFDLWVRPEVGEALKRNIRAAYQEDHTPTMRSVLKRHLSYWHRESRFPWNWRIDVFKPWRDRQRIVTPPVKPTREDYTALMTWNINGFHSKIDQIKEVLATQKVAICVLQETLVSPSSPPARVDGYVAFCEPWEKGFRGLAILVDDLCSNRWEAISKRIIIGEDSAEEYQENYLNTATNAFNKEFDELCRHHLIKRTINDNALDLRMPRKVQQRLKCMKGLAKKLADSAGSAGEDRFRRLYAKAKKDYKNAHNAWQQKQRVKSYERVASDLATCNLRNAWKRVKENSNLMNTTGFNMPMKPSQPLRDQQNVLQTDPEEIRKVMAEHYKTLLQDDESGQMRDQEHWHGIWGEAEVKETYEDDESLNIAHDIGKAFEWKEYLMAIREMNGGTSPGMDEIHIDVLKGLLAEECMAELVFQNPDFVRKDNVQVHLPEEKLPCVPRTNMGAALCDLMDTAWRLKRLPMAWEENVVVSLFKKGNPEAPDNYRGVTLISVVEKVLTGAMMRRLYKMLARQGALDREQGGFRSGEEAIAQFIALQEAVRRRHLDGKTTVGLFIDFKKAYDKVPHGLLWLSLEKVGVTGPMLEMIKAIYRQTQVSVRAGGGRSEPFALWRGLRQGCLLSPLLFVVFMTGFLHEAWQRLLNAEPRNPWRGVRVPGVNEKGNFLETRFGGLTGLLYADDIVALFDDPYQLQGFVKVLHTLCKDIGMELGIEKCGAMIWTTSEVWKDHFWNRIDLTTPNGTIPKVTEYKYLGIIVDEGLISSREKVGDNPPTEARHAKVLADKGRGTLYAIRPVLKDRFCPLAVKIAAIRTFIAPRMMYGGEWLGFKQTNAEPAQRVINTAMEWALGLEPQKDSAISVLLSWELGVPLIEIEMGAARTRLYAKACRTRNPMQTWLPVMAEHYRITESKKMSWSSLSRREIELLLGKKGGGSMEDWAETRVGEISGDIPDQGGNIGVYAIVQKHMDENPSCRSWITRSRAYEAHVRANKYASEALTGVRKTLAGIVDPEDLEDMVESPERTARRIIHDTLDEKFEREEMLDKTKPGKRRLWEYQAIREVKDAMMERTLRTKLKNSDRLKRYDEFQIACTRGYLRSSVWRPDLREGVRWLAMGRAQLIPRINEQWDAIKKKGDTPNFAKDKCPLCGTKVAPGWEFFHMLTGCMQSMVAASRKKHLHACIELIRAELLGRDDLAQIFIGKAGVSGQTGWDGVVAIYLAGGVVKGNFDCSFHIGYGQLFNLPNELDSMG
ncbi:LINE-1 retrotransposable element ORF2 protein, partial [Trametes pubescens]